MSLTLESLVLDQSANKSPGSEITLLGDQIPVSVNIKLDDIEPINQLTKQWYFDIYDY